MEKRPIQENYRFCPRCAAPNPEIGQIPFRCGECNFAAFFGPVAAVGGLIVSRAELLLVRRAREPGKGKWGLPGGFIDRGETAEQALVREIREETGLRISKSEYLMTFPNEYNYSGVVAPVLDLFFVCEVEVCEVDGQPSVNIARDELEHFEWSQPTPERLDAMAFASNRLAIECWMQQRGPEQ